MTTHSDLLTSLLRMTKNNFLKINSLPCIWQPSAWSHVWWGGTLSHGRYKESLFIFFYLSNQSSIKVSLPLSLSLSPFLPRTHNSSPTTSIRPHTTKNLIFLQWLTRKNDHFLNDFHKSLEERWKRMKSGRRKVSANQQQKTKKIIEIGRKKGKKKEKGPLLRPWEGK